MPWQEAKTFPDGEPYKFWKPDVPRIYEVLLNSIIYLYPDKDHADRGEEVGGSGFLVGIPSPIFKDLPHLYAVTNRHVISGDMPCPVIRLSSDQILEQKESDWVCLEDGTDLAVLPIDKKISVKTAIMQDLFITKGWMDKEDVGIGDEVVMIGRFLGHDGKETNIPSVRFGNIAIMPHKPIPHPGGIAQEGFLVEARSLAGYSGSPVFYYEQHTLSKRYVMYQFDMKLLGVDWGHLQQWEPVHMRPHHTQTQYEIQRNSGMLCVIPAWKLRELLDCEQLVNARTEAEKKQREQAERCSSVLDKQNINDGGSTLD